MTLTPPTATDTCMGSITATTTDPLTYNIQGTYTVTWTYDDGNGNTSTQTQTVIILKTVIPKEMHVYLGESIQNSIASAFDGDIIIVHSGTYYENIDFLGKNITVKSTAPSDPNVIENTIIDGRDLGSVVTFKTEEGNAAILEGITIRNGKNDLGGGIFCYDAQPLITNCTIELNMATKDGGGIYCGMATPNIVNCTIELNIAANDGGGIYCFLSPSPCITDCIITKNVSNDGGGVKCFMSTLCAVNCTIELNMAANAGGGIYCYFSGLKAINCVIAQNYTNNGGGIYFDLSPVAMIINCTFAENTAFLLGSGLYYNNSVVAVINSIFWDNYSEEIYATNVDQFLIINSNIQNGQYDDAYTSEDNIYTNPLFIDPNKGNYCLQSNSECIDTGADPNMSEARRDKDNILRPQDGDGDGDGVAEYDMGAFEYLPKQPVVINQNEFVGNDQNQPIDTAPPLDKSSSNDSGSGSCFISIL